MNPYLRLLDDFSEPAICGTLGGYDKHKRNKSAMCAPCVEAKREYDHDRGGRETPPRKSRPDRQQVVEQMKALDAHRAARAALREQTRVDL